MPDDITVHLDAGYDSDKTRALLEEHGSHGRIAHRGKNAPIQASRRWHVERTHAWQNAFHRLARCYEQRATVIDALFDLADTIITVRSLSRQAWATHRWNERPNRRP
ncbi:IS5 family transposase [Streptomyces tendae]